MWEAELDFYVKLVWDYDVELTWVEEVVWDEFVLICVFVLLAGSDSWSFIDFLCD